MLWCRMQIAARAAFISMVVVGCAGLQARMEGSDGPVAWRVLDLAMVTRDVDGKAVDSSTFTLAIRNVSDRAVTFTQMDRTVHRPGTNSNPTSHSGRWELRPGVEWKVPLSSRLICRSLSGCSGSAATQPMWRIVLTGEDDQQRPIHVRMDIVLPPQIVGQTPVVR